MEAAAIAKANKSASKLTEIGPDDKSDLKVLQRAAMPANKTGHKLTEIETETITKE
jgi:hypothetical protein